MKVKVLNNICCKDIQVGSVLDIIPGMQADAADVYNIPAGMCYLCKTENGKFQYVPATSLEIIDSSTIDWEKVRIQAAIAAMQGLFANKELNLYVDDIAKISIDYADSLVDKLKKEETK